MENRPAGYPDDAAAAIWRRAAELQAEAEIASERARTTRTDPLPPESGGGLTRAEVEAVAAEAGIAPEHVRAALSEYHLGQVAPRDGRPAERWTTEARRAIHASLEECRAAVLEVCTERPYLMTLADLREEQDGTVLVFTLPSLGTTLGGGPFEGGIYGRTAERIAVSVRPAPFEAGTCEVHVRSDVPQGTRQGIGLIGGLWGFASIGWGAIGGAVVGAKAIALAGAVLALPAVVGAVAGGALAHQGYRWMAGRTADAGRQALDRLAEAVEGRVRIRRSLPGSGPDRGSLPPV